MQRATPADMLVRMARPDAPLPPVPLNRLGIAFGLAGLSGTWTAAADADLAPMVVGDALWIVTGATLVVIVARYLRRAVRAGALGRDLRDPVLGPFAALAPTVVSLLGARLVALDGGGAAGSVGRWLVGLALVASSLYASWFLADLVSGRHDLDTLHPGYLLPTVAAGLVAAQSTAVAGWPAVAMACFAVGVLFWLVLSAVLIGRLAFRPPLPAALTPTLAILSAPPAVAGNAWFAMNGVRADDVSVMLLGTVVVFVALQLVLLPQYLRLSFTLGFWAVTFTTAASATYGVRWLALERPTAWQALAWVVIAAATAVIGAIAVRSVTTVLAAHRRRGAATAAPTRAFAGRQARPSVDASTRTG